MKAIDNRIRVLQSDAAQLNVLARRDVDDAEVGAVLFDRVGVEAERVGVRHAVRQPQAHHEAAGSALIAVDEADPLQPRVHVHLLDVLPVELPGADRCCERVDIIECTRRVLLDLRLLDRVALLRALHRGLRKERCACRSLPCGTGRAHGKRLTRRGPDCRGHTTRLRAHTLAPWPSGRARPLAVVALAPAEVLHGDRGGTAANQGR
mmetsp:Transcript_38247/g.65615  ORF Transcript_38247/g.65615 Transcript_38247/m.65615 type:complete len:207 (+) Transcript_38247:1825-2445(+)